MRTLLQLLRKTAIALARALLLICLWPFYTPAGYLRHLRYHWSGGTLRHATVTQRAPFSSASIAIFACYPGHADPTMPWQLAELRRAGFEILLVANRRLDPALTALYAPYAQTIIERPNIGRDIGAYRDGYLHLQQLGLLEGLDELLLINDTLVFPLFDATTFWRDLRALPYAVTGPYENFSLGRHLQSFMILMRQGVPSHPAVRAFWNGYRPVDTRLHAVRKGEVGFSRALRRAGISFGPLCDALYMIDALPAQTEDARLLETLMQLKLDAPPDILGRPPAEQRALLQRELGRRSTDSNVSHSAGLFLAARGVLPLLKKDLLSRGTANPADLWWLRGVAEVDLLLVLQALKEKRLRVERSLFEQIETDLLQIK